MRLNRQYEAEADELEHDAPTAAEAPILRRHVVLVFVDTLDLAAARAIQYARTLTPDELRAVHFDLDPIRTEDLAAAGPARPRPALARDRRAAPTVGSTAPRSSWSPPELADGDTEVTVLIPRLQYTGCGTASSTTAPRTRSPRRWPTCPTAT